MLATKLNGRYFTSKVTKCIARMVSTKAKYEEIKIPVPWGHMSGKWWGPHDKQPILTLHGWQDNAGTFDRLVPLLPPDTGIVAFDLPGHGLSSHLPAGTVYHINDAVLLIRRIVEYFKWDKVSLMGHSFGCHLNAIYTMLYPHMVNFLICFEGVPPPLLEDKKLERMVKSMDSFIKYDNLNSFGEPPSYTTEELVKMLHEGSRKSIDLESCKYLLQRNIRPCKKFPNKYCFTRDPRIRVQDVIGFSQRNLRDNAHRISCPFLLCIVHPTPGSQKAERIVQFVESVQSCNKQFELHYMDGSHHFHLNNPEAAARLVTNFIEKYGNCNKNSDGLNPGLIVSKQPIIEM